MDLNDALMCFGLTRQESTIYLTLLSDGALTGYEVAKRTGISRSNTYTALACLVDKGAAWLMEGTPVRYIPVEIEEFSNNKLKHLEQMSEQAGKRNEKRFSLPGIRLPRLSLPDIPWTSLLLGLAALALTGLVLWVVWSSLDTLWSAARGLLP